MHSGWPTPDEYAEDAYRLGLEFWQRGDLCRARFWLDRAVGKVPQAADKLAELDAFMTDLDLDETSIGLDHLLGRP